MIDINKAKEKVEQLDKRSKGFGNYGLKIGENRLRIVPSKECPDWPFKEVRLYWGITKGCFVSPLSYGDRDPIKQELDVLRKGTEQDVNLANKLSPKTRVYVTAIIRGEQDRGVVWVDFPPMVFKYILNLITDQEWGDASDPKQGYDIIIKKEQSPGQQFPKYNVVPKPRTKLSSDKEQINTWLQDQPDFKEVIKHYSEEQLKQIWNKYLNGSEDEETTEEDDEIEEKTVDIEQTLDRFRSKFPKK